MTLIDQLLDLFRIEMQVRGLRSRLDSATRYYNAQKRLLNDLLLRREELLTRKRQTQAKIGNLENEARANDERTEKLREELTQTVNNKQYSAILAELNTVKSQRANIDDRMLNEMATVEEIDKQIAEIEEQVAEREKLRDGAEAELNARKEEVGGRLAELEQKRDDSASRLPAKELAVFEELAENFDGEAMAPLEEVDRRSREYACSACHMHVPFELVSALMTVRDTLTRCAACGRILYMKDEVRGALAKK